MGCCSSKPAPKSGVAKAIEVVVDYDAGARPGHPRPLGAPPASIPAHGPARPFDSSYVVPSGVPHGARFEGPARAQQQPGGVPAPARPRPGNSESTSLHMTPAESPRGRRTWMAAMDADPALVSGPLEAVVRGINGNRPDEQLQCTRALRKLLTEARRAEEEGPVARVVEAGVCRRLVQLMEQGQEGELRFEAAWVLTNVASGTSAQTQHVVDCGALPAFVRLLADREQACRDQAAWALGNIAGDSAALRDAVLREGALPALLRHLASLQERPGGPAALRQATWALSNLARGKPPPRVEALRGALGTLARLLQHEDADVLADACATLCHISDGEAAGIEMVVEAGVAPRLVELLAHPSARVQKCALRTIGNIVTGTEAQTQAVLNLRGALPAVLRLTFSAAPALRKEACWALSNVAAGSGPQVQAVIEAGALPRLAEILADPAEDEHTRREAAWAVTNATHPADRPQLRAIAGAGLLPRLVALLESADTRLAAEAAAALENFLRDGGAPEFGPAIVAAGGRPRLARLRAGGGEAGERAARALALLGDGPGPPDRRRS